MFRLQGFAYKTQHPAKAATQQPNADMTARGHHFALILDGVSGVPPPLRPEALSEDLRNCLRFNLQRRLAAGVDRSAYDQAVIQAIGGSPVANDPAGGWLCRLVHFSAQQTTALGSTVLAVVSVIGKKLTYTYLGDCAIMIFRKNEILSTFTTHFVTTPQHMPMQDAGGNTVMGPKQLTIYEESHRSTESLSNMVGAASYGVVPDVKKNDVVVVCSDGITDNVPINIVRHFVEIGYESGPQQIAYDIVEHACRANAPKPDDISIYVGFIVE